MKFQPPPRPQDEDKRDFKKGDLVRAYWGFSHGCPPGPNTIEKGTLGTVTGASRHIPDPPFHESIRMVPVKWATGFKGEVVDSLLEKEMSKMKCSK
jgi:hypothetical protein